MSALGSTRAAANAIMVSKEAVAWLNEKCDEFGINTPEVTTEALAGALNEQCPPGAIDVLSTVLAVIDEDNPKQISFDARFLLRVHNLPAKVAIRLMYLEYKDDQ